jgi:hypothetical protein
MSDGQLVVLVITLIACFIVVATAISGVTTAVNRLTEELESKLADLDN